MSLFAMDGWACSRVRFSLIKKNRHMRKCRGAGRQKPQHRKGLPHGEKSSPPAVTTGGPRATPCQCYRPLEGRCWPRHISSRLAGARTDTPAAGSSFLGGCDAAASKWPRRLGPSMTALFGRRGRARCDRTSLGSGGGCRPEGGEIHMDLPLESLSGGCQRRLEADPRGFGRGGMPSPQSRHCPRHHRRLRRWGTPPQALPSAWIWTDAPLRLGGQGFSFSPPSY